MKKFSMFAALAAIVAVSGLAHAGGQGADAGAFFPGGRGGAAPYPHRFHQGEIVDCIITGVVYPSRFHDGSANLIFVNSHGDQEPPQPIFGVLNREFLAGYRDMLLQKGICPNVHINDRDAFVPGVTINPPPPAPPIAGEADYGYGGAGYGGVFPPGGY